MSFPLLPSFLKGYIFAGTLALYIALSALLEDFANANGLPLVYVLLALLASYPVLTFGSGSWFVSSSYVLVNSDAAASAESQKLLRENLPINVDGGGPKDAAPSLAIGCRPMPADTEYYSLWRSLLSLDFTLVFLIFFLAIGSGITIVNNLAEIVFSRLPEHYNGKTISSHDVPHSGDTAALVVLFSVTNTFGALERG